MKRWLRKLTPTIPYDLLTKEQWDLIDETAEDYFNHIPWAIIAFIIGFFVGKLF